jgi:hypothetical protein
LRPRIFANCFVLIAKPYGDRGLGITVARLPGEYRVKYRNATDATARMAETLDQAVWPAARTAREGRPSARLGRPDCRAKQQDFHQL